MQAGPQTDTHVHASSAQRAPYGVAREQIARPDVGRGRAAAVSLPFPHHRPASVLH